MLRRWAVNRRHRVGHWWLCARCWITWEHMSRPRPTDGSGA